MRRNSTNLPVRSEFETLPPSGLDLVRFQTLLDTEASAEAWRIIEVFSKSQLPFEVNVAWSAGTGVGSVASVTIARASRLSVCARALRIQAANLCPEENCVGVLVSDGYSPSRNQYEVRGVGNGRAQTVRIPAYAERFRVELAHPRMRWQSMIQVMDAHGVTRSRLSIAQQPAHGTPLGGAHRVSVIIPNDQAYRVVFFLML